MKKEEIWMSHPKEPVIIDTRGNSGDIFLCPSCGDMTNYDRIDCDTCNYQFRRIHKNDYRYLTERNQFVPILKRPLWGSLSPDMSGIFTYLDLKNLLGNSPQMKMDKFFQENMEKYF